MRIGFDVSGTDRPTTHEIGHDVGHGVQPVPAADAALVRPARRSCARRRGGRVRRHDRHGPPRPAVGRRPADVRGDRHDDLARRAHRAPATRLTRALRRLPSPGRARAPGGLDRPRLRRPLRARHRMGLGTRRAGDVRRRYDGGAPTGSRGCARRSRCSARARAGETVDYDGCYHRFSGARQDPPPVGRIPIVIGGTGPKTLALVRDFADWWNVHVGHLDRLDALRSQVGDARVSIQQMVAIVPAAGTAMPSPPSHNDGSGSRTR